MTSSTASFIGITMVASTTSTRMFLYILQNIQHFLWFWRSSCKYQHIIDNQRWQCHNIIFRYFRYIIYFDNFIINIQFLCSIFCCLVEKFTFGASCPEDFDKHHKQLRIKNYELLTISCFFVFTNLNMIMIITPIANANKKVA